MTEIALRGANNGAVAAYEPATAAIASLADWAQELDAAGQIAVKLCQTPFVPQHFRGKPADAAAAILTGHELGLSPMASLRSIFLISGTPGMYAKSMVAVVQSRGHEVWVEEQSDDRVVVCGRRKGSEHVFRTVWDTARVVKAKLTTNGKYRENPQQMMVARGQSEICRQVAADALHGIPYTVEELYDLPPVQAEASVARVTAAEILGQPPATVDEEPARPEPMSAPQSATLRRLFTEQGITEPQAALARIAEITGRSCAWAEVTADEAGLVIATLAAPTDEDNPIADLPISKPGGRPISEPMKRKIMALAPKVGLADRDLRLDYISDAIGRPVSSTNDLSSREAGVVIEMMEAAERADAEAQGAAREEKS